MFHICVAPLLAVLVLVGGSAEPVRRHCQIPCGIYGDKMRVAMILEDAATIEKGMMMIGELSKESPVNYNQLVRWVQNKDTHAQAIQDNVAAYWLAQRVKTPKPGEMPDKYFGQLVLMHGITVAAMKCKQTTDPAHVATLREKAQAFSATYFSEEDLKHLREHAK